jgi:hypothetical protein
MKSFLLFRLAAMTSVAICAGPLSLRAEFMQPIAANASNGQATQDTLINGQGLDDPSLGSPASNHSNTIHEHKVSETVDFKTWQPVAGVTVEKLSNVVRASISTVVGEKKFYRLNIA